MSVTLRKYRIFLTILIIGAALLAACGGAAASPTPVNVQVTLTEFKIDSSLTNFKVGVPYHFTVVNNGTVAHQFVIMPPTTTTITPEQAQSQALAGISPDQLQPGATATLDYTFTKPYAEGQLEFACHVAGHYEAGMHTSIVVTQ
jgi:uncharacterized cupredoxin-like copper-binding protein